MIKRIIVFCGSSKGNAPVFSRAAEALGREFCARGIGLVYGGGDVGLMGVVADTVMQGGGEVTGVIPGFLKDREVAHHGISELIVTGTMHERKQRMHELGDAVIAMPGGFGTLDELFELLTWKQLGLHAQPIGLLNIDGFFDHLIAQMDHMAATGFLRPEHRASIITAGTVEDLMDRLLR